MTSLLHESIEEGPAVAPTEVQTRFVFPLVLRRDSLGAALEAMRATTWSDPKGAAADLWTAPRPKRMYRDEVTDDVLRFLFSHSSGEVDGGGLHLRIDEAIAQRWLQSGRCQVDKRRQLDLRFEPATGIELFLTQDGVGALSVTVALQGAKEYELLDVVDFNHHVAQLERRRGAEPEFFMPHPQDDAEAWARVPEDRREVLAAARPVEDAELGERLGRKGGRWRLAELVDWLLEPLEEHGLQRTQPVAGVFTALRFPGSVDFGSAEVRTAYAPILAALTQVEESLHAGLSSAALPHEAAALNRRHWAGVALQGSAHLVSDQSTDERPVPYDEERLQRVRDKYFVPYLVALFQRLTLRRATAEAGDLASAAAVDGERLSELRRRLLLFAVWGFFPEVSLRSAVHRYYRTCQAGFDVQRNFDILRGAIDDLDSALVAAQQTRIAQAQQASLDEAHRMHVKIEWIEIFMVSAYGAGMFYYMKSLAKSSSSLLWWGIGIALLCGAVAALILRPWKKHDHH